MLSYNKVIEICDLGETAELADLQLFRERTDIALGQCQKVTGFKSRYLKVSDGDIYAVSYEIELDDNGKDEVHDILSPW